MKVVKKINNNVALAVDGPAHMVVMGSGIGFNARPGDIVDEGRVEQRFVLQEDDCDAHYVELLGHIPGEILEVAAHIARDGEEIIGRQLPGMLVLNLADHISFARERLVDGVVLEHPLACEVVQCYPLEHKAGLRGVDIMASELGLEVPESEAVFLAIHFANALGGLAGRLDAIELAELTAGAVSVIERSLDIRIDRTALAFTRFVAHLRCYLLRRIDGDMGDDVDGDLFELVSSRYRRSFDCACEIDAHLNEAYEWGEVDASRHRGELMYLTLHINRLVSTEKSEGSIKNGQ